jgi:hypothetical protein
MYVVEIGLISDLCCDSSDLSPRAGERRSLVDSSARHSPRDCSPIYELVEWFNQVDATLPDRTSPGT